MSAALRLRPLRRALPALPVELVRRESEHQPLREDLVREHRKREERAAVAARIAAEWMLEE
jgi:hypothetical protein